MEFPLNARLDVIIIIIIINLAYFKGVKQIRVIFLS